jgi:selenocysteine-specific elongation factor
MIVGTAGHVDHGKTALVRALTGVEGDRLKHEKERGVTIELGFAYLPLGGGRIIGFVDAPGHEQFVRTMAAGAAGIDFALLVVACDDGVKPQTREHLAILDLMGVERGLVALTKADLASEERRAEVARDVQSLLAATRLAGAETLAVSVRTGEGIAALRDRLVEAREIATRPAHRRFRMAVDRAFLLTGVGLVVTGPVLSGVVRVGDTIIVSPSGLEARVRSLHAQNQAAEMGRAGDRCALSLTGRDISKAQVSRGDMLVDPSLHAPTSRIDARLTILEGEPKPIATWFPARLHHATADVGARVVPLESASIAPGGSSDVQLVLDRPIAAAQGDRFILRDVSGQRTIGGGAFIDLRAPARKRRTPERAAERAALALADPQHAFAALLAAPPFIADFAAFARDRALGENEARRIAESGDLVLIEADRSTYAAAIEHWRRLVEQLGEQLAAFHAENPDLQGFGAERLRMAIARRWPPPLFRAALAGLMKEGRLVVEGGFVRLPGHVARLSDADLGAWREIAPLLGGPQKFRPPRVRDIAAETSRDERDLRRLLKLASRLGWVDEIAHDHFFLRETTREMIAHALAIGDPQTRREFAAAEFRDRLDNGRKVAIQILEFFDRHGVTLRRGDLRRLNPHRLDLFGPPVFSSGAERGGETFLVGRSDFKSEGGSEPVSGGFDSHSPPPDAPL